MILQLLLIVVPAVLAGKDICALRKDTGPCRGYFPKYYYNSLTKRCEEFIYGGCRGNANNFADRESCQKGCATHICRLPPKIGLCFASFPRYFFNTSNGQCENFIYGGCGGNDNNFLDLQSCQQTCAIYVCSMDKDSGTCKGYHPSSYYDRRTGKCRNFVYGGCDGNSNRFQDIKVCEKTCSPQVVCNMPPVRSSPFQCAAYIPRYFYNPNTKKCHYFIYGGCGGTANNFRSLKQCESVCINDGAC